MDYPTLSYTQIVEKDKEPKIRPLLQQWIGEGKAVWLLVPAKTLFGKVPKDSPNIRKPETELAELLKRMRELKSWSAKRKILITADPTDPPAFNQNALVDGKFTHCFVVGRFDGDIRPDAWGSK